MTKLGVSILSVAFAAFTLLPVCSCSKESLNSGASSYKLSMNISEDASLTKSSAAGSLGRVPTGRRFPLVSGTDTLYLVEYMSDYKALDEFEKSGPETKGNILTTSSISGFKMSAYYDGDIKDQVISYPGSNWNGDKLSDHIADASKKIYFMDQDVTVSHDGGNATGTLGNSYYWINLNLHFWSYSNATPTVADDHKSLSFSVSQSPSDGGQDAEATKDIIVAYNFSECTDDVNGTRNPATDNTDGINVKLYHALAVVDFDVNQLSSTLEKITIDGVYTGGTCTASGKSSNETEFVWKDLSGSGKYSQSYESTDFGDAEDLERGGKTSKVKRLISNSKKYFFFVPQTIDNNHPVSIGIKLKDDSETHNSSFPAGVEWLAGKRYTYTLQASGGGDGEEIVIYNNVPLYNWYTLTGSSSIISAANPSVGDIIRFEGTPGTNFSIATADWRLQASNVTINSSGVYEIVLDSSTLEYVKKSDLQVGNWTAYPITRVVLVKKSGSTSTKLTTPSGLTASNATDNSIDLSWTAVSNAAGYEISYGVGQAYNQTYTVSSGSTTSATISNLSAGTEYYFKIKALADGSGSYSNSVWSTGVNCTTSGTGGGGSTFDLTGYTAGSVIPASAFASATAGMCMKIKFIPTNSWCQMNMCYKDTWDCIDGIKDGSSDDCTYNVNKDSNYLEFSGCTVNSEVTISIPLTSESLSKISSTGGITIRAADNITLKSMTIE